MKGQPGFPGPIGLQGDNGLDGPKGQIGSPVSVSLLQR